MARSTKPKVEPTVEIIGLHRVEAAEPCHLVELWIHDNHAPLDMSEFTQADPNTTSSNWQVPWDDSFLNAKGDAVLGTVLLDSARNPRLWLGEVRMAFFFHYLELDRPLITPFGEVALPPVTKRPRRLHVMVYDAPD